MVVEQGRAARGATTPQEGGIAVATSQRGWGEALTALLRARTLPAVALNAAGRPWDGETSVEGGTSVERGALPDRWGVLVVDAADVAAPDILDRVRADACVGVGEPGRPPLKGVDAWVDPSSTRWLVAAVRDPRVAARQPPPHRRGRRDELTTRERAVLALLREGLTNAEVAERLGTAPNTVRTHVQNILAKLGVHSRFEAAVMAHAEGGPAGRPPLRREVSR